MREATDSWPAFSWSRAITVTAVQIASCPSVEPSSPALVPSKSRHSRSAGSVSAQRRAAGGVVSSGGSSGAPPGYGSSTSVPGGGAVNPHAGTSAAMSQSVPSLTPDKIARQVPAVDPGIASG
jgi:hypothetical protein